MQTLSSQPISTNAHGSMSNTMLSPEDQQAADDQAALQKILLQQQARSRAATRRSQRAATVPAGKAVLKADPAKSGSKVFADFMAKRKVETAQEIATLKREQAQQIQQNAIETKLGKAGIPQRYAQRGFGDYAIENEEQAKVVRVIRSYAGKFDGMLANGTCMAWVGRPGTGKTHLACALMRHVIESGHSAMMMSALMAVGHVFDSFGDNKRSRQDAINDLCAPDLLVLDEVGELSASAGEVRWFFELMNSRYNAMRPTVLISNESRGGMEKLLREKGVDRLTESGGQILDFSWGSHRPQNKFLG